MIRSDNLPLVSLQGGTRPSAGANAMADRTDGVVERAMRQARPEAGLHLPSPRVVALLCYCTLSAMSVVAAPLVGRIEGDTYISANGEFRIQAPVLPELGGLIEDSASVVTFHDDFGTHISIACFEMDATQRWELDTRGLRDYLLFFFNNVVMVNFSTRFPGSKVESARYLPELLDGSLIAYSLLPGGSSFETQRLVLDPAPVEPVTAKRGTLVFIRHRRVYVISAELAERVTQRSSYQLTVEQEDTQLTSRLTLLAGRMTFTRDQPRNL